MKCPYCNEEMEKGYIKSSHLIHWGKEKNLGPGSNDINLINRSLGGFFKGNFVESNYCGCCNKIIISLD